MRFDRTGKVSLEGIYTQPDPRAYFTTLRELDYCIPQLAKPYFQQIIGQYRESRQVAVPTVVDVGCSYGVNAALLRCDATMDDLYDRYADTELTRQELLERDRELVRSHGSPARFVGLDVSRPALEYASAAGFLDDAVQADLETREPTARQRALFADADIVISTGCLGYVTGRTLVRVARRPPGPAAVDGAFRAADVPVRADRRSPGGPRLRDDAGGPDVSAAPFRVRPGTAAGARDDVRRRCRSGGPGDRWLVARSALRLPARRHSRPPDLRRRRVDDPEGRPMSTEFEETE
nr:hypothetical protein GCM10020092_077860 [Actinoplanes digitatis]